MTWCEKWCNFPYFREFTWKMVLAGTQNFLYWFQNNERSTQVISLEDLKRILLFWRVAENLDNTSCDLCKCKITIFIKPTWASLYRCWCGLVQFLKIISFVLLCFVFNIGLFFSPSRICISGSKGILIVNDTTATPTEHSSLSGYRSKDFTWIKSLNPHNNSMGKLRHEGLENLFKVTLLARGRAEIQPKPDYAHNTTVNCLCKAEDFSICVFKV